MVILSLTNCPPSLRGDLSKWLNEINTGVYVGKVSARVRDALWDRICENIKEGQATMIYSAANAQGYAILVHNTDWIPTDYDGVTLMKRPLKQKTEANAPELKPGFSRAAKYEMAKRRSKHSSADYVILDLETSGLNADKDRIIEVGILRIHEGEIADTFHCLIRQERPLPQNIIRLTGITDEMLASEGIDEKEAMIQTLEFIESNTAVGYNVKFDISFISATCRRHGLECTIRKTKDVMAMARRTLENAEDYKLGTVAKCCGIEAKVQHRALEDCKLTYGIYSKLNEIGGR